MVCGHRRRIVFAKSEIISKALQIVLAQGGNQADFKLIGSKDLFSCVNIEGDDSEEI